MLYWVQKYAIKDTLSDFCVRLKKSEDLIDTHIFAL